MMQKNVKRGDDECDGVERLTNYERRTTRERDESKGG